MSYVLTMIIFLMMLFPVLLPAAISGFHAITDVRRRAIQQAA